MSGIILQESSWVAFVALLPLRQMRKLERMERVRVAVMRRALFSKVTLISERIDAFAEVILSHEHAAIKFFESNDEAYVRAFDLRKPGRMELWTSEDPVLLPRKRRQACIYSTLQKINSIFYQEYTA